MFYKKIFYSFFIFCCFFAHIAFSDLPVRKNIALRKQCIADSYNAGAGYTPAKAVDSIKSFSSRWENNWQAQPAGKEGDCWIYVDLGNIYTVDSVAIYWEHSGSKDYLVQAWTKTSSTPTAVDSDWTTLLRDTTLTYSPAPIDMCLSFLKLPPTQTRFIRVRSYKRMWSWGVSIMELEVYGDAVTSIKTSGITNIKTNINFYQQKSYFEINVANNKNKSNIYAQILNTNGRLINMASGINKCVWRYNDIYGKKVPMGIYLIKLQINKENFLHRVIISK
jgi:hypothetical protein